MVMVLWQLGAEPFTAPGAVAWGTSKDQRNLAVPGEPRDRELAFRALTKVAKAFNPWFEAGEPQVVVANPASVSLLARLGRRLAYLPTDGKNPADPDLVRFGRHLRFLADRSRYPGQQLILVLTELLRTHWVTELSDAETQNLAALDAAIAPPKGKSVHEAVLAAEQRTIGPVPSGDEDDRLDLLMQQFNTKRARQTNADRVTRLQKPIVEHYRQLIFEGTWGLLWRCLERERELPTAPGVARRWREDMGALARHLDWMAKAGGIRRLRQTNVQAAHTLRSWEQAQRILVAEEAIDDRMRMIPYVMSNDALVGEVIEVDLEHRELAKKALVRRPRIRLALHERCLMPIGKQLYWTGAADKKGYTLIDTGRRKGGWFALLQNETSAAVARPELGDQAVFSIHRLSGDPPLMLPQAAPWTHTREDASSSSLESDEDARSWE